MKFKRYNKKNNYSYTFGAYTTLELLKKQKGRVVKVLFKEEGLKSNDVQDVMKLVEKENISFEVNSHLIDKISYKENTYVVGVFEKYEVDLEKNANHVVLIDPSSPGNVGTIMRTMASFNFKNLAIIKPGIDIFNPKVSRSSMGSFFNINWKFFDSFEEYIECYDDREVFLFVLDGDSSMGGVKAKNNFSLVFGNESKGIEKGLKPYGKTIYIPQSRDIDSLNLSVSVAIALYHFKECV